MFVAFDKIKELADKQGISINILEEKLGYGTNTLYRLKRSNPSSKVLKEIADYFGVSADYLLGRTDNPRIASDEQNDPAVDNLTQQAIVMFRKETEGLSDSEKERFNVALAGLMKTARQLIQDDSNWK
ncbi:helix-turn-helix domain-containing protein [Streptococcus suis]|uniref:helix-turn-helix domain-containing protein n=1 Tax=Streptococcus suis TaxID=1307 RepID=UPI0003FBAB55|nr:helix-turn-helix transcriptional regulator [Streptococcus suis]MBM7205646.1 helix-turn-helix transcriptional regulator [Streptococcus suis]MBY5032474.1 helix-turn-helix domain-containing protein [Streptococcus suis]MBY5036980.1 helix-turn-helix domain-containing protein [Streptococcus suis]MCG9913061.1 helix-turn-helix domain-containing protein [Streptococcus suis]MCG9921627.1 helix-turn-helix domain-containing protein [Streptococcus suis]